MKHLHLCFLSFVILFSCNSKPQTKVEFSPFYSVDTIPIPYQYDPKDSIDVKIEIYKVKNLLFSLLDSVICSMETCSRFNPSKAGFHLSYKHVRSYQLVTLETIESCFFYNTARDNAMFFYRGYSFYYEGNLIDSFFEKTGNFLHYRGVNINEYMADIDDSGLYWRYILQGDRLEIISYLNCDSWWYDERYKGVY